MDTLSLEEILKAKSKDFVLDQVSEIVESKKTAILNREQVILSWILNAIYKNVSKKSTLQKSSVPFILDIRVWNIFSKIIEKRKDFSIDMSLLKGIGVVCSATLPASPFVSCMEIQIEEKKLNSKTQVIELCASIMSSLFKFSNSYWPSVDNYSSFFVSILPSILDTIHSHTNVDPFLLSSIVNFLNTCCVQYIQLLHTSRFEKRYQSTLKFIEYLLPIYKYFSLDHEIYNIEKGISSAITDSIHKILQESFFPQNLHISDTTKLIEDYSSSFSSKEKNKSLSGNLITKINESIKKYPSSLNIFPIILGYFIQFIQKYRSIVDTLSNLNLNENLESLQFMFFKELLAAVSDQLLKGGNQTLSIQQLNVIDKMLQTISKYNIYNSRDNKHADAISTIIESTYDALSVHPTSKVVFNILIEISNLDYSLLEPKLTSIFTLAFNSHDISIIESILLHFLSLYSKLRQFERFFEVVLSSKNSIDVNQFLSCYQFSQNFSKAVRDIPIGQIPNLCNSFQAECQKSWHNLRDFTVICHLYILFLSNIPLSKANANAIFDFISTSYTQFISVVYTDTQVDDMRHIVLMTLYTTFMETIENCINYLPYSLQGNLFTWESSDESSLLVDYINQHLNYIKNNSNSSLKYILFKLLIKRIYYLNWTGTEETSSEMYLALLDYLPSVTISSQLHIPHKNLNILQEIQSILENPQYFNIFYWKLITDNIDILMGHLPAKFSELLLEIILSNIDYAHDTLSIGCINAKLLGNSRFYELNQFRDIFVSVIIAKLIQIFSNIPSLPPLIVQHFHTLQSDIIEDFPTIINSLLTEDILLVDYIGCDIQNIVLLLNIFKLLYSIPTVYFQRTDQTRILQMVLLLERIAISLPPSNELLRLVCLSRKILHNMLQAQPGLKKIIPIQSSVWLIQSYINPKLSSLDLLKQSTDLLSTILRFHSVQNLDLMKYFKKLHKDMRQNLVIQHSITSAVLQWLSISSSKNRDDLFSQWVPYLNRVKRSLLKSINQIDPTVNTAVYLESVSQLLILYYEVMPLPLNDFLKNELEETVSGILQLPWVNISHTNSSEKHSLLTFLRSLITIAPNLSRNTIKQLIHNIHILLDIYQGDKDTYNNLLSLFSLLMKNVSEKDNGEIATLFNYQLSIYELKKFYIVLDCVNLFLPTLPNNPTSAKFKYQLLILLMTKSMQLQYQNSEDLSSILLIIESILKNLDVYYVDCVLTNLNMVSCSLLSPSAFIIYAQILLILLNEKPNDVFKCAASYILCLRSLTMKLAIIVEKAENKIACLEQVGRLYQIIASHTEFSEFFIYMIADYLEFVENYHFVDINLLSIQRSVFELMSRSEKRRLDHLNTILSPSNKVNFRKLYNQFQRDFMFKPEML